MLYFYGTLFVLPFVLYLGYVAYASWRFHKSEEEYINSMSEKERNEYYDEKERMYYLTQGYTNW